MLEFQKKKNFKKFIYSPLFLIILAIIFLLLLKGLWGVYQKEYTSALNLSREQSELDRLSSRQNDLAQSISYLKTDQGVETEIREKFRVAKEGESIAMIVDNNASVTAQAPIATTTSYGFWGRIFHWFW